MASTTFINYQTVIDASWLNDVNSAVYSGTFQASTISPTNISVSGTATFSGTITGTAISNYLASPPAIGGTTPSTGKFTSLTNTGLTSGRVTYAGTGGLLQDSSNLTFSGNSLGVGGYANISGFTNAITLNSTTTNAGYELAYLGTVAGNLRTDAGTFELRSGNTDLILNSNPSGSNNIIFKTGSNTERMRIGSSGKVGIGTTAPISKLTVIGSGGFDGTDATYSGTIQIADDVASAQAMGGLEFKSSSYGSGYGWKICNIDPGGGTPLTINYRENSATWTEGFRFKSGGLFILQGGSTSGGGTGIAFPATQSASSDANTLDDYEEGTWTPNVGGSATYSVQSGTYTKVGRLVTIFWDMTVSSIGTGSGAIIFGAPFTASNSPAGMARLGAPAISWFTGGNLSVVSIYGGIDSGTSQIVLAVLTAAASGVTNTPNFITSGTRIAGTLTYFV